MFVYVHVRARVCVWQSFWVVRLKSLHVEKRRA